MEPNSTMCKILIKNCSNKIVLGETETMVFTVADLMVAVGQILSYLKYHYEPQPPLPQAAVMRGGTPEPFYCEQKGDKRCADQCSSCAWAEASCPQ